MSYQTTVTSKGQMTIPKVYRDKLRLGQNSRVTVEMEAAGKSLKVQASPDFLAIINRIKPPKSARRKNVLKARKLMEKNYGRA